MNLCNYRCSKCR